MDFRIDRIPGFGLGRTSHLLQSEIRHAIERVGLDVSAEGLSILFLLKNLVDPIRVSDLARLAVRDGTTLKRQIDGLIERGFVSQAKDETDRRAVLISCTPKGIAVIEFIQPSLNAIRGKAMQGLDENEIAIAAGVLDRIQINLLGS